MTILVTGGAGFIGSNVVHHLLAKPEVTRLVNLDCLTYAGHLENLTAVATNPKYVFEQVDLRDQRAVLQVVEKHQPSHVLHLAAESHVDRSIAAPGDFIHTNVLGTFHLLEACRACWGDQQSGVRFHHVSTDEVYGSLGSTGLFTETTPYAPQSPYSASKAASDMLVRTLPSHLRTPFGHHKLLKQLRAFPVSGKAYPGHHTKCAASPTDPGVWRWSKRA